MTERIEKAYYLKEEELAVLLSIMGVRQLYGFRMDRCADIWGDELHRILFGMARKGILSLKDGKLLIHTQTEAVLRDIVGADSVLILTGGEKYPESCIYAGNNMVFVQLLGQSGKICRIEPVCRKRAAQKMQEYGWTVPGAAADAQAVCTGDEETCLQLQKQAGILYHMEKDELLQKKEVLCTLTQYSVRQNRKIRRLLILNGVLGDYMTVSDGKQNFIYPYSQENSEELLGRLIGGAV